MRFTSTMLVIAATTFNHAVTAIPASAQFTNAQVGIFSPGLGTCGQTNVASDLVASLNAEQFGPNKESCSKQISITYEGKSIIADILDECPGCPFGNFNLSPGAFAMLADPSLGVLDGVTWYFV